MIDDIQSFLKRKRLRKALYLGEGLHPELSGHWNLTVYFVADYSKCRAWVYGNFFCVEEVSLDYLRRYFHISLASDTECVDVFNAVRALSARRS